MQVAARYTRSDADRAGRSGSPRSRASRTRGRGAATSRPMSPIPTIASVEPRRRPGAWSDPATLALRPGSVSTRWLIRLHQASTYCAIQCRTRRHARDHNAARKLRHEYPVHARGHRLQPAQPGAPSRSNGSGSSSRTRRRSPATTAERLLRGRGDVEASRARRGARTSARVARGVVRMVDEHGTGRSPARRSSHGGAGPRRRSRPRAVEPQA